MLLKIRKWKTLLSTFFPQILSQKIVIIIMLFEYCSKQLITQGPEHLKIYLLASQRFCLLPKTRSQNLDFIMNLVLENFLLVTKAIIFLS